MIFAMVFKACHDPLVLCRFYAVGNMILVPQWFILGLFGYGIWKANRSEIYPPDIQVTWRLYTFQMVLWNVGVSPLLEGCICPNVRRIGGGNSLPWQWWRGFSRTVSILKLLWKIHENPLSWGKTLAFTMFLNRVRVAGSGTWNPQIQGTKSSSTSRPYCRLEEEGYTLWWTNIAMENGHWNSGFSH